MEDCVKLLESFLKELDRYREASAQNDAWYDSMQKKLSSDQQIERMRNQENLKQQEDMFKRIQQKSVEERDENRKQLKKRIAQKKDLLKKNIASNLAARDKILEKRDGIVRPEFFRYAYRYKEFGDFFPEVSKLEDFEKLNLDAMVDKVNDGKTPLWINELKALLKSEDMMLEYAALANLFAKARYLCEVDNDALRETANLEILQLEQKMEDQDTRYMKKGAALLKRQQNARRDNAEFVNMFEANCKRELTHLQQDYQERQMACYEELKKRLGTEFGPAQMKAVYDRLEEAQREKKNLICSDGTPLNAKLGKLWFGGSDNLSNTYVKRFLERDYPFMISEGRFCIPGIV